MEQKEKCFVIMPISDQGDYPEGHFTKVYDQIFRPAIEDAGYEAYRVDENNISDSIIVKIFEAIQNCPMALCDLSNRNPNVLYELGIRQAYDKPVVLVQDDKTERIFDVSGITTIQYKSSRLYENVLEARRIITQAIIETKKGKRNSIVKIVKAQTAKVSTGEMSREDKIEILLSGLSDDIKQLKYDRELERKHVIGSNTCMDNNPINPNLILEKPEIYFPLRADITNNEIEKIVSIFKNEYNVDFNYKRKGNNLVIKFEKDVPYYHMRAVKSKLMSSLGSRE